MKKIREFFLEKKNNTTLYLILIIGVILLVFGNLFIEPEEPKTPIAPPREEEEELEKRLAEILKEAYGEVSVMITYAQGREIVPQVDKRETERSIEENGRTESTSEREEKTTLVNESGGSKGITLKTISPKAQGAVIVAAGGEDIRVQEGIKNAVRAALNIAPHNIVVLQKQ